MFLKVAKQGSTLAGIMDAFAISVSHGLQYGVPLRAFVEKFTNMRFEPAGMTDDPDIRFATSLVDYIFRRLAVEYLTYEERRELGILTVHERIQPTLPGVEEATTDTQAGIDDCCRPRTARPSDKVRRGADRRRSPRPRDEAPRTARSSSATCAATSCSGRGRATRARAAAPPAAARDANGLRHAAGPPGRRPSRLGPDVRRPGTFGPVAPGVPAVRSDRPPIGGWRR